jgi:hypothetical protein
MSKINRTPPAGGTPNYKPAVEKKGDQHLKEYRVKGAAILKRASLKTFYKQKPAEHEYKALSSKSKIAKPIVKLSKEIPSFKK